MLAPRTAARFGVIPHSEILKRIADRATLFTTIVSIESKRRIQISARLRLPLEVSAAEKKIKCHYTNQQCVEDNQELSVVIWVFTCKKSLLPEKPSA